MGGSHARELFSVLAVSMTDYVKYFCEDFLKILHKQHTKVKSWALSLHPKPAASSLRHTDHGSSNNKRKRNPDEEDKPDSPTSPSSEVGWIG
eukprot:scaffold3936_cov106-Skeletonema_menzelii.AAC.3